MRILAIASMMALTSTAALSHETETARPKSEETKKPQKGETGKPHSGGTDKYGCHKDHSTGEYHCHNPKAK